MPILRPHFGQSSLWDWDLMLDRTRPSTIFDQRFGIPVDQLDDDQIFASGSAPSGYSLYPYVSSAGYRPRRLHPKNESGCSQIACDKERFEVKLDVQQFSPEEVTVKTVKNVVVIEGKHDEKQDEHGYIQRSFTRKYVLPADVKPEKVVCNLSSDGVLTISAPRINEDDKDEKVVPIIQTHRPAVVQRQVSSSGGATTGTASSTAAGPNEKVINIQRETSDGNVNTGK